MSAQLRVLEETCRALLRMRGEASSTSLAEQVVRRYGLLEPDERTAFFGFLLDEFSPDPADIDAAVAAYQAAPGPSAAKALGAATESARIPLLRAVNTAEGGIQCLLTMRTDCLAAARDDTDLAPVDSDLADLMRSWFNRGFLTLQRISWETPAAVLEKLIEYEAVHEIQGWSDLQRRLEHDRRCYGFFHPSLPGEPLIFVEVALTHGLASSIQTLLHPDVPDPALGGDWDTAIFYSITNCQTGLTGIPLGNFLIKRVTDELHHELDALTTFSTLSPVPGYVRWVRDTGGALTPSTREAVLDAADLVDEARDELLASCATYLVREKRRVQPLDPVARFHLRNGARLERINWAGDVSAKGLAESHGMLVNYVYDPAELSDNHEAYVNEYRVRHGEAVAALLG
ncbi:MAG: malonyl-CoA decarboxylase family protein [Actinomycetota bacterium]